MDVNKAWNFLEKVLGGDGQQDISAVTWVEVTPSQDLRDAIQLLREDGILSMLEEWLHEIVFESLSDVVGPRFWGYFGDGDVSINVLSDAFTYLSQIYDKQYLEAAHRLKWLQMLAVSSPATGTSQENSAFTPVKRDGSPSKAKAVCFEQPKVGCPPLNLNGNEKSRAEPLRLCHDAGMEGMELGDEGTTDRNSMDNANRMRTSVGMDSSYIPDTSQAEHSLLSESISSDVDGCFRGSRITDLQCPLESLNMDEDDEDESFIRSPIGGNKKLMSTCHTQSAAGSDPLLPKPNLGGSVASLRASSLTSTPGLTLQNTPVPVTPIIEDDSIQVFGNDTVSGSNQSVTETPSLLMRGDSAEKTQLPEASVVFGHPVSARPLPGRVVNWNWSSWCGSLVTKIQLMIKSILFYTFPAKFSNIIKSLYSNAFLIYKDKLNGTEIGRHEVQVLQIFQSLNSKLEMMGLMELISGSAVTEIVHSQIEKHINEECTGSFDTSFIKNLEQWLDQQVLGWLKNIYTSKETSSQMDSVNAFRGRLRHFIYEKYGKSLITQFFDIIIDFPDSKPAIQDLSTCLEKTDLRSELVTSLKAALESRLLHPGVNTAVILTAYIAAIKSLRLLEPAGVILELVCEPVGRYLRSREDTVRCIVASLTDDGNNELVSELVNTKPLSEENDDEDGHAYPRWEEWKPDPVDADPSSGSRFRRSADILSTLVNIYGSKELFVNEYRALLADRILMPYNYDVERELRYLELLKLRFGEAQLHFCEVMLRDVAESRRVNARIQEAAKSDKQGGENSEATPPLKEVDLSAMILSAQFWPAFRDEKIKLPSELQGHLDKYTRSFEQQKQNRTLVWKPHLGLMNIEIEFNGDNLSFSVSPVQAAIIMKFQEKSEWSLECLSQELEMTPTVLSRKLAFWQGHGLVQEEGKDKFVLVRDRAGACGSTQVDVEEEVESAMASAQQLKEEEMQILWTYIQNMLANLDCLTLERIHAMLRMFATEEPGSEISLQELKSFLDNKVKDQILMFSSGVYRLNK